jgi:SAM-dependent methyltransferase
MSEVILPPSSELFTSMLGDPHGDEPGWYFNAGDPEYWKYSDQLIKPDGKVLDVGIGLGRSSLFFALNGMEVIGYDTIAKNVVEANEMAWEVDNVLPCDMKAIHGDVLDAEIPEDEYDLALLAYIHHLPSKEEAYKLMDLAMDSLKPGGHIYYRGIGRLSSTYDELVWGSYEYDSGVSFIEDGLIEHPCACSGEYKTEPSLHLQPLQVMNYFAQNSSEIIHSQTLTRLGQWNMMFGEDFRSDVPVAEGGMITVIARK